MTTDLFSPARRLAPASPLRRAPGNGSGRTTRRWAACLGAGLSLLPLNALAQKPADAPSLTQTWQDAASFLINDAHRDFADATRRLATGAPGPAQERERTLGEAATLLNVQPRSDANLQRVQDLLGSLIQANPDDDAGIFARYLLGRLHAFHVSPPRRDESRRLFRELAARHAGHPVAEHGLAVLVLIDLYENVSVEERERRFTELGTLAPTLKTPAGRRQFHLNLGQAGLDLTINPAKLIPHLVAADEIGITRTQDQASVWTAIGELARSVGRNDLAAEYYRKFLTKYQRDNKHYTIQQRLASLKADAPAAPAPAPDSAATPAPAPEPTPAPDAPPPTTPPSP